jgi:hypothetical protein
MVCEYKNILGIPGEGFHKTRIFGYALNDILGTIVLGYILKYFYKDLSIIFAFFIMFLVGQLCHIIFCVDTEFIKNFNV